MKISKNFVFLLVGGRPTHNHNHNHMHFRRPPVNRWIPRG